MCWVKLPRHPGRADAWPLCGPWPRPHLAAAKLVELRSSVNLVAMPHQPLDRPVASLTNPGLRDVRYAHIAPPRAVSGSPRCGCRGERQNEGDTTPGCLGVAALRLPGRPALAPLARLAQPDGMKKLPRGDHRPHVSVSWGRSLSHANDQESHPLPDPAAARRCGKRRPVIRC
jgi:hypothetical protein